MPHSTVLFCFISVELTLNNNNQDSTEEDIEMAEAEEPKEKAVEAWAAIKDAASTVFESGRALLGFFPPELKSDLENGVMNFEEQFKKIITWIEDHAPRATIIVNTIYNPIPDRIIIIPVELSNKADELIQIMNNIILEESKIRGYFVADVYSSFADNANIMSISQFNFNPFVGFMSIDIIHPNREGHTKIAELIYDQYVIAREVK